MRKDGRRLKTIDPLFGIIPHIMPNRYDAQVFGELELDYTKIKQYINEKRKQGIKISLMTVLIAAYVRMVAYVPEINRFVIGKKVYARNDFWVCFAVLKQGEVRDDKIETIVKIKIEFTDTIFDIAQKVNDGIEENRKPEAENKMDKLVSFFMNIPIIPGAVISFVKQLDKIGLMPKMVIDGSPFHTSLFITNMASIKMGSVYHHLYEFGTTSVFLSIGRMKLKTSDNGQKKTIIPLGCNVDERICAGATFARGYSHMKKYLAKPSLLETALTADEVVQDIR